MEAIKQHNILRVLSLKALFVQVVLILIYISTNVAYSSEVENLIEDYKVSEVRELKRAINNQKIYSRSNVASQTMLSSEILQSVKKSEQFQSSINLIVALEDNYCELEIEKRSRWSKNEKIYLMKELRKELQIDVLNRIKGVKPKLVRNFDPFNAMEVTVSSENELLKLMKDPRVKSVSNIIKMKRFVAESLSLINHSGVDALDRKGEGVTVAVIDSGIDYTLPHFGNCTIPASVDNEDCSVVEDLDFGFMDGFGADSQSDHGTRVGGIVHSVASSSKLISLDVFPNTIDGSTTSAIITQALQWVATNAAVHNIVAVNLSLGGGLYTGACDSTLSGYDISIFETLRNLGVTTVAASGNDFVKSQMSSPACISNVVSVGSVSDVTLSIEGFNFVFDEVDGYSNSSSVLDLLAPGSLIGVPGVVGSGFGTSFAAPHVAGSVALLRADDGFPADTIPQTIDRLKSSGDLKTDAANGIQTPRINLTNAFGIVPEITSPLTGDTLTSDSVTVTFDPMGTVPTEWALRAGNTGPGSFNLAIPPNLPPTGVTSQTISGLPVDGSTFTISLYAFMNGAWTVMDSEQVTAFTAPPPAQPEITSPLTGDTLTSDSVTVTFDPMGTVPTEWALRAGNTGPGSFNLAIPPNLPPTGVTSQTISGLPVDGSTFTISLYAFMNGAWTVMDSEQVTAFTAPPPAQPEITSPLTGDTLTSDSVTVTFDPMGTVPTEWALRAGNTGPGSFNLAIPPNLPPTGVTSQTISGLPVDGSTFTISLYAFMNGAWTVMDSEQVTAFTAPAPAITSPLVGDTLTSDSVTVTFDPMGTVPTEWALRAGNTGPGSFNLAIPPNLPPTGVTSQTISGLPVDGSTFTISLYAFINGVWVVMDSIQVTAFTI